MATRTNWKAIMAALILVCGLSLDARAADSAGKESAGHYKGPTAEEALAFLQSLPPIYRKIDGEKQLVQPWADSTVKDVKTMTEIAPGGHVDGGDHLTIQPEDWRFFTAFESLETAKLWELHGANDRAFYHLGHLPQSVKYVFIELGELSDDGVKHLQGLQNLEFLGIGWTKTITDGALRHMAGIPSLQEILVSGCKGVTGSGVEYLTKLDRLKTFKIAGTSVGDAALRNFGKLGVEELDLSQNAVTFAGLKELLSGSGNLPNLKTLTIKKVELSDGDIRALQALRPDVKFER